MHQLPWPAYDESQITEEFVTVVVQVNGKVRDQITVPIDMEEEQLKQVVLSRERVQNFVQAKIIWRVIVVPKKLVNIVAS